MRRAVAGATLLLASCSHGPERLALRCNADTDVTRIMGTTNPADNQHERTHQTFTLVITPSERTVYNVENGWQEVCGRGCRLTVTPGQITFDWRDENDRSDNGTIWTIDRTTGALTGNGQTGTRDIITTSETTRGTCERVDVPSRPETKI